MDTHIGQSQLGEHLLRNVSGAAPYRTLCPRRRRQRLCLQALTFVVCAAASLLSGRAQVPLKPLSKEDVITLLKGDVSPSRVGELAKGHRISFGLTHGVETELCKAGADDGLINLLRALAPKSAMRALDQPFPLKGADKNTDYSGSPLKAADHGKGRIDCAIVGVGTTEIALYKSPKELKEVGRGKCGEHVEILDKTGGWTKVRCASGARGYLLEALISSEHPAASQELVRSIKGPEAAPKLAEPTSMAAGVVLPGLFQKAEFHISTIPAAVVSVYLDDQPRGSTGANGYLDLYDIRPGQHHLRLHSRTYQSGEETVDLVSGFNRKAFRLVPVVGNP
jgi:hypothetical protein